jgi:hypothetical protein
MQKSSTAKKKTHSFSVELIAVVVPSVVLSNMIRESLQNIH